MSNFVTSQLLAERQKQQQTLVWNTSSTNSTFHMKLFLMMAQFKLDSPVSTKSSLELKQNKQQSHPATLCLKS